MARTHIQPEHLHDCTLQEYAENNGNYKYHRAAKMSEKDYVEAVKTGSMRGQNIDHHTILKLDSSTLEKLKKIDESISHDFNDYSVFVMDGFSVADVWYAGSFEFFTCATQHINIPADNLVEALTIYIYAFEGLVAKKEEYFTEQAENFAEQIIKGDGTATPKGFLS